MVFEGKGATTTPVLVASACAVVLLSSNKTVQRAVGAFWGRVGLHFLVAKQQKQQVDSDSNKAVVTNLYIHPVKSLKSVSLETSVIDTKGLQNDRCFMLVTPAPLPLWATTDAADADNAFGPKDATHRFLTQRQCPSLATVTAKLDTANQTLTFTGSLHTSKVKSVTISTQPAKDSAKLYRSTLWSDIVQVQDMGDAAAAFFNSILNLDDQVPDEYQGNKVRLVVQSGSNNNTTTGGNNSIGQRTADDDYVPAAARTLSGASPAVMLADGFPILIACQASLDELNRRLVVEKHKPPLPMGRFRPNIVISGTKAFEEDEWKVISIGGTIFHIVKGCPRCKQSCTDQQTGKVTDEPLATLAEYVAY